MMPLEDLKDFSMQHISNKDSKRSLFHSLSNNVNTYPSWWNSSASNCPKNTFNNTESHAQHASQVKHCFGTGIVDQDSSSTQSTDQSHQSGSSEGNLKQQCIPAQSGNDNSYDKHVDGQMKSILSLGTPEVAFQHPQIEYNSSTGCLPYTYNDQYYGSFLAAFGPRAVIYPGVWYLGFFNGLGPERTESKMVHSALMLAGFEMEVVKTTSAGHAKKLASTVDYSSCPNGIICVGGDGIVNEGGFTPTDVFAV